MLPTGERGVPDRPYPRERQFRLPLSGPGAWLVQLHAGGRSVSTLVVRSELELVTSDAGVLRRVTVSRRGRPAQGVQVREVAGGEVIAAVTDVRGAAMLPAYAPALAFDGEHYAFSSPSGGGAAVPGFRGGDELMRRLDERLEQLRSEIWQPLGSVAGVGLSAESL